jgi:FAD/FMN-containing dehydrogenase
MPETTLDTAATDELRNQLDGNLITPGHEDYEDACKTANGMFDGKRPAAIARCGSVDDVRAALAAARANDLIVSVRSGGHSAQGFSTCDGGLVIDISPMNAVEVDPEARTARVQGGANWGQLDSATQEHGLAVTGGRVTDTGVTGLTLSSGSGWFERVAGITPASLIGAQLVTADGSVVTADESENPDLLWALRGGGGNFGIVTELTFRLHPCGPVILAGQLAYPRERAKELLRAYRDFMESAPDELGGGLALVSAPPLDFIPEDVRGKPITGVIFCYFGSEEDGRTQLEALKQALGEPMMDMVAPMPYVAFQGMLDAGSPRGINEYYKYDFLAELSDEAVEVIVDVGAKAPSPMQQIILEPLGGECSRMDRDAMAIPMPDVPWAWHSLTVWPDKAHNDVNVAFAREFAAAMVPFGTGIAYPNFLGLDAPAARLMASFGPERWERLTALKGKWDPDNVFRLNNNIPPG